MGVDSCRATRNYESCVTCVALSKDRKEGDDEKAICRPIVNRWSPSIRVETVRTYELVGIKVGGSRHFRTDERLAKFYIEPQVAFYTTSSDKYSYTKKCPTLLDTYWCGEDKRYSTNAGFIGVGAGAVNRGTDSLDGISVTGMIGQINLYTPQGSSGDALATQVQVFWEVAKKIEGNGNMYLGLYLGGNMLCNLTNRKDCMFSGLAGVRMLGY